MAAALISRAKHPVNPSSWLPTPDLAAVDSPTTAMRSGVPEIVPTVPLVGPVAGGAGLIVARIHLPCTAATGAVRTWQFSDVVWQNPAGLHAEHLRTLSPEERLEDDKPEDWAFMESQELARLLAERGDGQRRYVASWAEHKLPGGQGRSATWAPRPFEQAKAGLIADLRRNLSTWAAWGGSPVRYSQALDTLTAEAGRSPSTCPATYSSSPRPQRREQ